ncbi:MAG: hypothetical protein QOE70_5741 [Chthoniobacter sp.]|jgi:hypothetical protein|nr:hypothetical protein [Chthoniobacter sp.]
MLPTLSDLQRANLVLPESQWEKSVPPVHARGIRSTYYRALVQSGVVGAICTRDFIANVVVPITAAAKVSWWAVVPNEYRGKCNAFVSHAWYDMFIRENPRGVALTLALEADRDPELFFWMDAFCLNQHTEITGLTPTLHKTLQEAGTVYVTISDYALFDRSWCMYELASAIRMDGVTLCARVGKPACSLEDYYSGQPQSAQAFDKRDKEQIDATILKEYGSWDEFDKLLYHFVERTSPMYL